MEIVLNHLWKTYVQSWLLELEVLWELVGDQYMADVFGMFIHDNMSDYIDFTSLDSAEQISFFLWTKDPEEKTKEVMKEHDLSEGFIQDLREKYRYG